MRPISFPLMVIIGCLAFRISGQVVLSEIMFNPEGSEQTDEFIEIFNRSESEAVDISDWLISDGSGEDKIIQADQGTILGPRQYGIILDADYSGQSDSYQTLIPIGALILTVEGSTLGSGGLSNSRAETVFLIRPDGNHADSVTYDISIPSGYTFERIDLSAGYSEWSASETVNGTPGFINTVAMRPYDLAVTAVQLVTFHEEYSGESFHSFEVMISNLGSHDADNASLTLFLDANEDSLAQPNEQIDEAVIFSLATGNSTLLRISWPMLQYGIHQIIASCNWTPDEKSENNCFLTTLRAPFPEHAVLINEIMADPLTGMSEWVEIINRLSVEINLQFWSISDSDTSKRLIVTEPVFISPDGYGVFSSDSTIFDQMNEQGDTFIFNRSFGFNNSEDAVFLFDPAGTRIDAVQYNAGWGNGSGVSLERIDVNGLSGDSSNWIGCTLMEGSSPGQKNSITPQMSNEQTSLHIAPNPFSPDRDGVDEVAVITVNAPSNVYRMNLSIYDIRGRKIRDLRKASVGGSGAVIVWDGNDNSGRRARVGPYIVLIEALDSQQGVVYYEKSSLVLAMRLQN